MIYFPTSKRSSPPLNVIPEEFPGRNLDFKLLPVLAPFWSNIDASTSGAVYYQLYTQNKANNSTVLQRTVKQFQEDSSDLNLLRFDPHDSARKMWVLVVTWYRVPPFNWKETKTLKVCAVTKKYCCRFILFDERKR